VEPLSKSSMAASAEGYTLLIVNLELVEENNLARRKVFNISKFRNSAGYLCLWRTYYESRRAKRVHHGDHVSGSGEKIFWGIGPRMASWGDKKDAREDGGELRSRDAGNVPPAVGWCSAQFGKSRLIRMRRLPCCTAQLRGIYTPRDSRSGSWPNRDGDFQPLPMDGGGGRRSNAERRRNNGRANVRQRQSRGVVETKAEVAFSESFGMWGTATFLTRRRPTVARAPATTDRGD
jgi:hypothetical protein